MTRVIGAALATLLVTTGCATGAFQNGPHETITILTHYGNDPLKSGLQDMVDEWNAGHPDIQVETQAVAYDDLLQTITVRQTGGQAPDIIQGYSLWGGQLAAAGVLADVPDDIADDVRDNYSRAAVGSVSVDGKVLGYPTEVQTYNLFYNKKLLADAGIDSPPATWDELEEAARKTTVRDDLGNIKTAGFGLANDFDSAVVHPFSSLLQAAGGQSTNDDGTAAFDSAAGQAALGLEKRLIDAKYADPSVDILKA
ncbi:MAG: ABC transporter substrate-binding protein, partial [Stackebrandtia sp.]